MLLSDILIRKEDNKCVVVINGQEIDMNTYNIMNLLDKNVDKNAVKELIELITQVSNSTTLFENKIDKKITINKTVHRTDSNPNPYISLQDKKHNIAQISSITITNISNFRPEEPKSPEEVFLINEINKSVCGITIGKTGRKGAYYLIKKLGAKSGNFSQTALFESFNDLGISLYFSASNDTVEEIVLSSPFQGKTTKGLRVNQSIDKAINLHGSPKIRSLAIAFWDNFSVFLKDEIVTSIKLR